MKRKCLSLACMVGLLLMMGCKPVLAFIDSNAHWARPQIDHLNSRELISGYPDGSYHPDAYVSREEYVTLLIKAIHKETEAEQLLKGDCAFQDAEGRWSSGYIELARELSIARGNGQGMFLPGTYISREEAVTMLVNCLKVSTQNLYPLDITDHNQISSWAEGSVAYAWQKGLIHGYPDGSFRPQVNISRAELACLLEELLGLQGDRHHFYGTLKYLNLPLKQITVELNGKEQMFELAANVQVYAPNSQVPVKDLNLPAPAYFDLDRNGKLAFIMLNDQVVQGQLHINLLSLPDYARATASSDQFKTYSLADSSELKPSERIINDPGSSLKLTRDAMKSWDFVQLTGASGRGQLVAIIDSGVDPGHPDLQYTKEKFNKIIDFVDLTNEGKVELKQTVQANNGFIELGGQKLEISSLKSVDGEFRYGYLETVRLPLDTDATFPTGKILVLASKSRYIDRYDSLYMDLNGNGQVNDELELKKFSELHQVASIKGSGVKVFNFVLAEMARDGQFIKLGYDAEGHGTMVAGIVAANGKIEGVAPDAQIIPIKIINSAGTASLESLKLALRTAAERGVKIAVVSMGQSQLTDVQRQILSTMAASLWQDYGMAICVAAGNAGPGLSTVAGSSAINNIISVGAYATPQMWQNDFGWTIKEPELWCFSSTGPSKDGQAAPLVVAPGSAVSTYPLWADSPYRLDQGSSMAAPHVAGAAALLMDAVSHQLYRSDPRAVWMALLGGAQPLKDYQPAEQGYGAINLLRSWKEIQNLKEDPLYYGLKEYSPEFGYGTGFYSRSLEPGQLSVTIKNTNWESANLAIGSLADWIVPGQLTVQLPANGERTIDIKFNELSQPGLYSGFLLADDAKTPGYDVAMLQTVVVPYKLASLPNQRFEEKNSLDAGNFKRYFFSVPEGSSQLDLSLLVGQAGRACMYVIAPDGSQATSIYAGLGDLTPSPQTHMVYSFPVPGTWEVVVYSSLTLSTLNRESSTYTLAASLETAVPETLAPASQYLVTALPAPFKAGEKVFLSLHFYNANSKMPVNDVVSIEGRLYEVKEGLVQLELTPKTDSLNLNIAF